MSYLFATLKSFIYVSAVNFIVMLITVINMLAVEGSSSYICMAIQVVAMLFLIPLYFVLTGDGEHIWLYRGVAALTQMLLSAFYLFASIFVVTDLRSSLIYALTMVVIPCYIFAVLLFDLILALISFIRQKMAV